MYRLALLCVFVVGFLRRQRLVVSRPHKQLLNLLLRTARRHTAIASTTTTTGERHPHTERVFSELCPEPVLAKVSRVLVFEKRVRFFFLRRMLTSARPLVSGRLKKNHSHPSAPAHATII
jgi:hypothetical protein